MERPPALMLLAAAGVGVVAMAGAFHAWQPEPYPVRCKAPAEAMTRLEMVFGMGRKQGDEIGEEQWRAFLEAEVTPRFPDGLTVLTGYGQWRSPAGILAKETSRLLLIWSKPSADLDEKIEAVRKAWKMAFQQESVMRVDDSSCVSF